MGIFLKEVMNINSNNIINISEATVSLEDYLDLMCEQCNDILLETESNFKIKKEDLLDPNKFKQILNKLEHDTMDPPKKQRILVNMILTAVSIIVLGGAATSLVLLFKNILLSAIVFYGSLCIGMIGFDKIPARDNGYNKLIKTTEKGIKKLKSKILSTKNPDKVKNLEQNLKVLEDVLQKLYDERDRVDHTIAYSKKKKKEHNYLGPTKGGFISTKDSDEYIKRLKKNIAEEDDPKRKKKLQDHLKIIEKESEINKKIEELEKKLEKTDNEVTAQKIINKINLLNIELHKIYK